MRRTSFTPLISLSTQEPLIVVEESNACEDVPWCGGSQAGAAGGSMDANVASDAGKQRTSSEDSEPDSPVNPYLLCPFPDMQQRRKHSLPSLQITEGIMASQVRRLSDFGADTGGISPKEVEFLATLSQQANPAAGGRRHSVVTISAVPPLFGRNRRESLSGMSMSGSRRGSIIAGPPLTDHRGSIHNLQLDIMDGIVQTRKSSRSGSGVWTAPVLQETENNVPVQT